MEIFRTLSAIGPVPAKVYTTPGTFSATATRSLLYTPSSTEVLSQILDNYINPWLFFPTANILVKIESYGAFGNNQVWLPTGQVATVTAEQGQIVEGRLHEYTITNIGASTATVNGVSLIKDIPVTEQIRWPNQKALDPVLVDASASNCTVSEQL